MKHNFFRFNSERVPIGILSLNGREGPLFRLTSFLSFTTASDLKLTVTFLFVQDKIISENLHKNNIIKQFMSFLLQNSTFLIFSIHILEYFFFPAYEERYCVWR